MSDEESTTDEDITKNPYFCEISKLNAQEQEGNLKVTEKKNQAIILAELEKEAKIEEEKRA